MENSSISNLHKRRDYVIEKCKSQINWWINRIVLIEAFEHGDVIFVAALTKWAIYKTHLFAIQYTKIAQGSNFYDKLCAKLIILDKVKKSSLKPS